LPPDGDGIRVRESERGVERNLGLVSDFSE
jgi:hypothetical protein